MSYNPGLLFYKHYYNEIKFDGGDKTADENQKLFQDKNKILVNTRWEATLLKPLSDTIVPDNKEKNEMVFDALELITCYPGLIIGTGYQHGSGMLGEYKTGFFFDHTTGMPVIPGSSVKGLLRSVFPSMYFEKAEECKKKGEKDDAIFWYEQAQNQVAFIQGLLSGLGIQNADKEIIEAIEYEIFEGMYKAPWDREKKEIHFPMRYRDCFFDAIITGSKDKYIFNDEYITPHKEPLKNPIPLQLLKVRPEVTFTFQFKLNNQYRVKSNDDETVITHDYKLNKEKKLELFRSILLFLGAGAKTNTGFGQFRDTKPSVSPTRATENSGKSVQESISNPVSSSSPVSIPLAKVKRGTYVFGELVKKEGNKLFFKLLVDGYTTEESCNYPSDRFVVGEILKLTVTTTEGKMPNLKIRVGAPVKI